MHHFDEKHSYVLKKFVCVARHALETVFDIRIVIARARIIHFQKSTRVYKKNRDFQHHQTILRRDTGAVTLHVLYSAYLESGAVPKIRSAPLGRNVVLWST